MKEKKRKLILGFIAGILVLACGSSLLFDGVKIAEAATRLYGVQQVVEKLAGGNSFVALELVPDNAYSSFGAYVLGEEPSVDVKLLEDCTNQTARRDKVTTLFNSLMVEKQLNGDGTAYPLYYDYNTIYKEQITVPTDEENWEVIVFEPTVAEDGTKTYYAEDRTGSFVLSETGVGDYVQQIVSTDTEEDAEDTGDGTVQTTAEEGSTTTEGDTTGDTSTGDSSGDTSTDTTVEYEYYYDPGNGTYDWVESYGEGSDTYWVEFEKLYYQVNLISNDWFVEEVLEYEVPTNQDNNIEVITITPTELETNIAKGYIAECESGKIQSWNDVDMLYISNSTCLNLTEADLAKVSAYSSTNDISAQTAYNIYEYVLNTSIPVILDSSIMVGATTLDTNMLRLAHLLWDYTTSTTPATYTKEVTNTAGETETVTIDVSSWVTAWPEELTTILLTNVQSKTLGTKGSVQGSVYINSDANMVGTDLASQITFVGFVEVADGKTYTASETVLTGISAVVNEIEAENFYNEINEAGFNTEYNTTAQEIRLSKASIIKYILNYAYRRATVYKETITVLDIEPTRYSTLTVDKIRGWLKPADAERIKQINIVQMTTAEYIGALSDLTAEYDMIYIGDCIGPSGKVGSMNQSSGATVYNDGEMDGLIYTHTGDTYKAPEKFKGLLNTEYTTSNGNTVLTDGTLTTRFSGNDITEEKMEELKAFVEAGYPVVIADKFYTLDDTDNDGKEDEIVIDEYYVDNASYLYKFMDYYTTQKPKDNVMSDDLDDSALLATYLNMSKLYISMVSAPVEYQVSYSSSGYIDSVQFLQEVNGKYILEYVFELADNAGAKIDTLAYEVRIYIDTNADGRYDETEELDGLTVRNFEDASEVAYDDLETGVRYAVSRELPKGYVGMIPWKLEVTQIIKNETSTASTTTTNQRTSVHSSVKGYTAVPADEVTEINIIQIKSASQGGLDLSENSTFQNLFNNVGDKMNYEINIDTVTAADYVSLYKAFVNQNGYEEDSDVANAAFYNSYFKNYDMIMIGFVDMFDDISSQGATMAIKMFIDSGRSVLFSHDTTSFVNAKKSIYTQTSSDYWGYYLNQYIRSTVGMDRYGVTESTLDFLKNGQDLSLADASDGTQNANRLAIEGLNKDFAYSHGLNQYFTDSEVHGYSNGNLVMQNLSSNTYDDLVYSGTSESSSRVTSISQVNKGQITTYPFDINISAKEEVDTTTSGSTTYQVLNPNTLTVKSTHSQYYQLDMKLDKTADGNSDIVVWYCLADGMYDAVPNDVRNNYYIYSAGNIMYTGMGHSGNSVSLDEAKLFVNTMIASFNSGKKDPTIAIVKDADNKGIIKNYSYRTYDPELGAVDEENEVISFYVNDSNIISGNKIINVKYYVEDSEGTVTITEGNETVYLKEISEDDIVSASATVDSNVVSTLVLKPDFFNRIYGAEGSEVGTVKIYIGAETTLDYDSTKADETTATVFTSITVKARDMFELD